MNIEIKKSIKPVNYDKAINLLEERVEQLANNKKTKELIWFLEHPSIFTGGSSYKKEEILDNSIKINKTSRGGKITWHGPGQLICYFVIDLSKRNKDIRKFIEIIENSIINSTKFFNINLKSDRNNIGIWFNDGKNLKKVGAIGIRVKKWIAYHGFSLNICNELKHYEKIVPCGIKDKKITNLIKIKKQNYKNISSLLEKNLISYLKI
tara:strand:- start:928 stop:1551 length:624 start_codon:yes stop_codon:yes gene_type:complete